MAVEKKERGEVHVNEHELYRMMPDCYEAFFHFTPFLRGRRLLEPAAGDGRLSRHLLEKGYVQQATLVELRPEEKKVWLGHNSLAMQGNRHLHIDNYLQWVAHYADYDLVAMNPPFSYALDFAFHACHHVKLGGHVCMLQSLKWLGTQKRARWFTTYRYLRYVYIISWRVTFELPNGDLWKPNEEFAWMVFKPGWAGAPTIEWLLKPEADED